MEDYLSRTRLLLGSQAMERLAKARVTVIGLGGVGSHAAEALARAGVGSLLLVDRDEVAPSNLNRQLQATTETVGMSKIQALVQRLALSAPHTQVEARELFVLPDNVEQALLPRPDYLVDAIDTVSAKLALIEGCQREKIPIISCMGTGNKLDPTRFRIADLYQTDVCPLCRVMRRELRKRGIDSLRVVYSDEPPRGPFPGEEIPLDGSRRAIPGSISFVPPAAGLAAAGAVIRALVGEE